MGLALSLPLAAFAIPKFPMNFDGTVTITRIDGTSVLAPTGSVIGAYDASDSLLAQFTLTTTAGVYGTSDRKEAESAKLSISEYTGDSLTFKINSPSYDNNAILSDTETYGSAFTEFLDVTQNLVFTGATPNSAVTAIAVTPASASIAASGTQQFTATATYYETDADTQDITTSCTWTSSDTGAATIGTNTGLATGASAGGTSTITASYTDATYGVLTDTASLTVTAASSGTVPPGGGGGTTPTPAPTVPMPTSLTGAVTATADGGGKTTLTTAENTEVSVRLPANAVSADTDVSVEAVSISATTIATAIAETPADRNIVGGYIYDITATSGGAVITEFSKYITVTLSYKTAQIAGLKESTLAVNYWDETAEKWTALDTTVYRTTNTLTAKTLHFTYFAIMGEEGEDVIVPITEMTDAQIRARIAEITVLIAQLQAQLNELLGITVEGCTITSFDRTLKKGMSGNDVKCLQIVLNSASDTRVAESGVGSSGNETNYFGSLTKSAVIKFQEKYAPDILASWNLTSGTGLVGTTTRNKLNSLLE